MFRQQLDDRVIETFFDDNLARAAYPDSFEKNGIVTGIRKMSSNELNPARNRLCEDLLAETAALGLSVYGQVNDLGAIILDIFIGDDKKLNSPGRLTLSIEKNYVRVSSLKINKPVVEAHEIYDCFENYPQTALRKFGWFKDHKNCYSSPCGSFDFKLSMLSSWVKKLFAAADKIAEIKAQNAKHIKAAEINLDRFQGILEPAIDFVQTKLPELKCKLDSDPRQGMASLGLYNMPVGKRYAIFKPADEYATHPDDVLLSWTVTRRRLRENAVKPVRMFSPETCIDPVSRNYEYEYTIWFQYCEDRCVWRCTAPTKLPNFKNEAYLPADQIVSWVEKLVEAEMRGYAVLMEYKEKMKQITG